MDDNDVNVIVERWIDRNGETCPAGHYWLRWGVVSSYDHKVRCRLCHQEAVRRNRAKRRAMKMALEGK